MISPFLKGTVPSATAFIASSCKISVSDRLGFDVGASVEADDAGRVTCPVGGREFFLCRGMAWCKSPFQTIFIAHLSTPAIASDSFMGRHPGREARLAASNALLGASSGYLLI